MAAGRNYTTVTKFILLGFSDSPKFKIALFAVFMGTYVLTAAWNLGLTILIRTDSHLHTPMSVFLSNFSFLEFCYVTSTTPKMLSDFFRKPALTSFTGAPCGTSCSLAGVWLSAVCWRPWLMIATLPFAVLCSTQPPCAPLSACRRWQDLYNWIPWLIHSVVCLTSAPLLWTTCYPSLLLWPASIISPLLLRHLLPTMIKFVTAVIFGAISILIIMIAYGYIIVTILKISSVEGRAKAVNTCASHLTAAIFFFGSGLFIYMHPRAGSSLGYDVSLLYSGDPHVESFDLQSEEQGNQRCS